MADGLIYSSDVSSRARGPRISNGPSFAAGMRRARVWCSGFAVESLSNSVFKP
jgi:hypothetical protein